MICCVLCVLYHENLLSEVEWCKEQVMTLIKLFRKRPVLWDQTRHKFEDKNKKNNMWIEIAMEMNISKMEVQAKMRKLTSQFYREIKKAKCGSGADCVKSKWYVFEYLQFLKDKRTPHHSRESGAPGNTIEVKKIKL